MQIWAETRKSALPIHNYSQILYQFLTFTQNLKRSRVIRIILTCIIFCNYGIHCKIQKKTKITILEIHSQYFFQLIVLYNLPYHNESTSTQTAASRVPVIRDWHL